jgi:glyoxylase-like metal-dependent hydrolase (beta-lactamase superfamily II)
VKQGDAAWIQSGAVDLLVDGGPLGSWNRAVKAAVQTATGDVEIAFVSHPHDDHFMAITKLLTEPNQPAVSRIITNGEKRGPPRDTKVL